MESTPSFILYGLAQCFEHRSSQNEINKNQRSNERHYAIACHHIQIHGVRAIPQAKPVSLGGRAVAWVKDWVAQRVSERDEETVKS